MPKKLTRLRIDEVSSVDRGAGEGVKIMLMKRDKDKPMPTKIGKMFSNLFGGSIDNSTTIDKSLEGLAESVTSILSADGTDAEKGAAMAKTFEQFGDHLKTNLTSASAVTKKEEPEMDLKALAKALGLPETATEVEINAAVVKNVATTTELAKSVRKMEWNVLIAKADFTPVELDFWKASQYDSEENDEEGDGDPKGKGKAKKAFRLASHTERAAIMKSAEPPLPPYIQKIMADNAVMAKQLAEIAAGGSLISLTKQATDAGLPESEGATIQKALGGDKDAVEKLLGFIKQATATAKAGGVFKEFGSSNGTGVVATPYDELVELAKVAKKADPKLSNEQAFAKVYEDPANIEIVKRERGQNRPTAA